MIYAVLNNKDGSAGVVNNLVVGDKPKNDGWINVTDAAPRPSIYWTYDGSGVFTLASGPVYITLEQFVDALNDDEYELYLGVDAYDKKAAKGEKQKAVKVKRSRNKLARYPDGLISAEFVALADSFVVNGILTQERFDEIIASF